MDEETAADMCPDVEILQPGGRKRRSPSETILVVDDDEWVLGMAVDFLGKEEGYHVLQSTGGEEALRTAEAYDGPIHLLLTDVVMPRLNGWMLARRLRRIRPETKVLLMTAFSSELSDYETALGDPVIMKPFNLADLAHKVRELLGYSSPFARRSSAKG